MELADVQADEVRVRIAASGICHADLLIRDGSFPTPMPVVLGHEGAGVVEAVGAAVTRVAVGDRVAWRRVPGRGVPARFACDS